MAFEGEPRVIPVKGISRAGADSLCEDGAMNEVIGLEYKDGSFVPYSGNVLDKGVPNWSKGIYVHKTSTDTNVIVRIDSGLLWMTEEQFNTTEDIGDYGEWNMLYEGTVKDVEFVKNIIIVERINAQVLYYRFSGTQYEEIKVNDLRNGLPKVNLYVTNDENIEINNTSNGPVLVTRELVNSAEESEQGIIRAYRKGISKLNELGRLHGYCLATYAYRLVSGEYAFAQSPILLSAPNNALGTEGYDNLYNEQKYYAPLQHSTYGASKKLSVYEPKQEDFATGDYASSDNIARQFDGNGQLVFEKDVDATKNMPPLWGNSYMFDRDGAYTHNYILAMASNALKCKIDSNIPAEYKGLVESCCIFISDQVPLYNITSDSMHNASNETWKLVNNSGSELSTRIFGYYFNKRSWSDIAKDISDLKGLYLVHEIPFKEIQKGDIVVDLKNKVGSDNLATRTLLPESAYYSNNYIHNSHSFVYNSRHHLFNYDEEISGIDSVSFMKQIGGNGQINDDSTTQRRLVVKAIIESLVDGNSVVVSENITDNVTIFNNYFSFPNPSATKMEIIDLDSGAAWVADLTPSKSGGYSYYLHDSKKFTPSPEYDGVEPDLTESNTILSRSNRIKVSETYFAYTFLNSNVYTIGNGEIIGMSSISTALSQDTFGQYPLLVFCTDGIYSLSVDTSGVGVYSVVTPFSREVCVNANSICPIDGAVLFASNKGLMIATSQGVQEFVPNLNGEPKHQPDAKEIHGLGLELYGEVITNQQVTNLINHIDMSDFREYVSDPNTYVTYASEKNKVMIYNGNKPYVYWIDIPTRNVTKLPVSIKMDNNNYPTELYVTDNNHFMELKQLSANVNTQTMFQTRPIKLDGGMKTAMRVIVRGYFNSNEADKWAVLLVLGSYDGINWQPLGLKQKQLSGGFNDLGCVVDRVSHKYMMVIFSASLNRDSHIDGIELTKTNKYNNKLK